MEIVKIKRLCVLDDVYERVSADSESIKEALQDFIVVMVDGKKVFINPAHITSVEFAEGAGLETVK